MVLSDLKGIGSVTLKKLENLGIIDIQTLLFHFPSRYIDRRRQLKISDLFLIEDDSYSCIATIDKIKLVRIFKGRILVNATLTDDTGGLNVTWFNNPYISSNFQNGNKVIFSGKIEKKKIVNPKIRKVNSDEDIEKFAVYEAIYPETRGIKSYQITTFIRQVLEKNDFDIKEIVTQKIIEAEKLIQIKEALQKIHFPNSSDDIDEARERLGFDEIYKILKEVNKRKKAFQKFSADKIQINKDLYQSLISTLPYQLTESQTEAIQEIYSDISSSKPMHRLLNGDVGSGKTIVASFAAAQVLGNNFQVILLAPTSVLANQHYKVIKNFFDQSDVKVHLITSDTRKEVEKLKKELRDENQKEIFIGTHALLFHTELFHDVGLLIIDEQHKFGVKQREFLENLTKLKEDQKFLPHSLSMSATPIPRTLALTLYGDLEVSIIFKPESRKEIITRCLYDLEMQNKMYEWIRKQISEKKEQVYVVCPLIEESEVLDTKSAINEFETLKKLYSEFNVDLLHGKIKPKLKDEILQRFAEKEIDILVSTSVIEVGIDNPNATIMIIEGAERFGLAQLHQIRGRVGRSEKQSFCFLKTTNNIEDERLKFFAENQDGFALAEYDLYHRGPGEVYGKMQSGIPKLKIANILDIELINRVKKYFK